MSFDDWVRDIYSEDDRVAYDLRQRKQWADHAIAYDRMQWDKREAAARLEFRKQFDAKIDHMAKSAVVDIHNLAVGACKKLRVLTEYRKAA